MESVYNGKGILVCTRLFHWKYCNGTKKGASAEDECNSYKRINRVWKSDDSYKGRIECS